MSIKNTAFQFCKKVQESPNRELIRNFIKAIHFNNETVIFRQEARNVSKYPKIQFLSYLIVAQESEKIEKDSKFPIDILEEDEIYLLASCHEQLLKLNNLCVLPILEKIPQTELALSPFSIPIYHRQDFDSNFELFEEESMQTLIKAFHSHPAIKVALETYEKLDEEIDNEHYFNDVASMAQGIYDATPFNSPEWLANPPVNSSHTKHLRHMLALVSLRDSLVNLNQLIFQALVEIDDKLIMFDDENIIDLSPTSNCKSGSAVTVMCQTTGDIKFLFGIEPIDFFNSGYLVLLKEAYGYKGTQLGRVEASITSLFSDYSIGKFNIRLIDENLNSFPFVLKSRDD